MVYGIPVTVCSVCGGTIYSGEVYGEACVKKASRYSAVISCTDCIEDEWRSLSEREKFEALGYDAVFAERCGGDV